MDHEVLTQIEKHPHRFIARPIVHFPLVDLKFVIVMDKFECTLKEFAEKSPISEFLWWRFAYQAADGLSFLHSRRILHRDIKPSNIFVESPPCNLPVLKLADFGVSTMDTGDDSTRTGNVGTEGFMAPEVYNDGKVDSAHYTKKSDIYSLGKTLAKIVPAHASEELLALVRKMHASDANERPHLVDIMVASDHALEKLKKQLLEVEDNAKDYDFYEKQKRLCEKRMEELATRYGQQMRELESASREPAVQAKKAVFPLI